MTLRLLTSITLLGIAGSASAACENDWICVDAVNQGNDVELHVRNLGDYPITFTLSVRTRHLQIDGPKTITRTLAPRQSEQAMLLASTDDQQNGDFNYSYEWTIGDKDAVHDDNHLYSLPYAAGKSYRVLQGYGSRFSHTGLEEFAIDLDMPIGTPVHAARDGVVARVTESNSKGCWEDGCGEYANYVIILHRDGTTGEYFHLQQDGVLVEVGDGVSQGQKIGYSGNTGHTTMPHLHFAVYRATTEGNTQSIPIRFLSSAGIVDSPRRGGRYEAVAEQQARN